MYFHFRCWICWSVPALIIPRSATRRNQTLHVGRVARPQLTAHRVAFLVHHHPHHHLQPVRTVVLGVPIPPDGLSAIAFEVDRGGIEEDQIQAAEQIAAAGKHLFLHQVLGGANHERGGPFLFWLRQRFPQPGHGPIQLIQRHRVDAGDGIVLFPLLGGTVAARRYQPLQHGQERGSFDGELEVAIPQQAAQDLADATLLPQAFKDKSRTDDARTRDDGFAVGVSAQDRVLFREPAEGVEQAIELVGGEQLIEPAQAVEHALADLAVNALIFDDEQVGAVAIGLGADEHEASSFVSSPE
jgi:hypothetical protein